MYHLVRKCSSLNGCSGHSGTLISLFFTSQKRLTTVFSSSSKLSKHKINKCTIRNKRKKSLKTERIWYANRKFIINKIDVIKKT